MKTYESAFEILTDDPVKLSEYKKLNNLMNKVVDQIKVGGWTNEQASDFTGFDISWIEDIQKGRLSKFYLGFSDRLCSKGGK